MTDRPVLNQIALSVIDLDVTERWFREGLGFVTAGGTRLLMSLPFSGKAQGLPGARSTCWFMIAGNPWFQLEMFQYSRPLGRRMPEDFRPCDTGYTRMGVHVGDFDATLRALARLGTFPTGPVVRQPGERRACVRSPDGVFVEIMEDDPLPDAAQNALAGGTMVRSVTLSTPDLEATLASVTAITGRESADITLHQEGDEAMWGLDGARCRSAVVPCGDVLVEIASYHQPRGRPRPDGYRISDIGILNIAFGVRDRASHAAAYARALAGGTRPNRKPLQFGVTGMVYVNDPMGFSFELLWAGSGVDFGFKAAAVPGHARPLDRTLEEMAVLPITCEAIWPKLAQTDVIERIVRAFSGARTRSSAEPVDVYAESGADWELGYRSPRGAWASYHLGSVTLRPSGDTCGMTWRLRYRRRMGRGLAGDRARFRRILRRHFGALVFEDKPTMPER